MLAHTIEVPKALHYVDGQWLGEEASSSEDVFDPATGALIASVPNASPAMVDRAVKAAKRALVNPEWRNMAPLARTALLTRLAELIEKNAAELAAIESYDVGKPVAHSSTIDVPLSASWFRHFAGYCTRLPGKQLSPALQELNSHHAYTRREPVGVVAAIVPWNFPLVLAVWKLAPALAAGCTVVLKPAEQTPFSTLKLAELIDQAGFPAGVFNLVLGGRETGSALVDHEDVAKISFTGSTLVGKTILQQASGTLKRVTLELGGKSPTIILPDADLDLAIPGATQAVFLNAGQICFAGTRLFVHRKMFDSVLEGIAGVASTLKMGPGLAADTAIGPVVSQRQMDSVLGRIESSKKEGAAVFTGGGRVGDAGYFIEPTILVTENRQNTAFREEFFGPVLTAIPYDDVNDIIPMANDSIYGLAANLYTSNLNSAHRISAELEAGTVWVNTQLSPDPNIPFGGFKQSGWGRENGEEVMDHYTETKSVIMKIS
jgi:phenylacetaldehyde dehydrogenase